MRVISFLFLASYLWGQTPTLIKELNTGVGPSAPQNVFRLTSFNASLFFTGLHAGKVGLFKSNGTSLNLFMEDSVAELSVLGNQLVIFDSEYNLWVSDGTPAGTSLIYADSKLTSIGEMLVVGSTLFFTANYDGVGKELWKTDGTTANTQLVRDINSGFAWSSPKNFAQYQNKLLFRADDGMHGEELWVSDGSLAGTTMVKDIRIGSSSGNPSHLIVYDGYLYFAADDGSNGIELWRSNLTTTSLFMDLKPGSGDSGPARFLEFQNELYFGCDDGTHGYELWKTNGTIAGTSLVVDIDNGAGHGFTRAYGHSGTLYIAGGDASTSIELYKSNGTAAGTSLVRDIEPGAMGSSPSSFFSLGNKLVFSAVTSSEGREYWTSDGTTAGTQIVVDLNPGVLDGASGGVVLNNRLYFSAEHDNRSLWSTDGTAAGTYAGPTSSVPLGSNPNYFANVGSNLFFLVDFLSSGRQLAVTDGTSAGTNILNVPALKHPSALAPAGNNFFVVADSTGALHNELWFSNGTAAGTTLARTHVMNLGPSISNLVVMNNHAYYVAVDEVTFSSYALWKSDGTAAGTGTVAGPINIDSISVFNNLLLMHNSTTGDIWASDGTAAGSSTIGSTDLWEGFASMNGNAYFSGTSFTGNSDYALYKTDGVNVTLVKEIWEGSTMLTPQFLNVIDNVLYMHVQKVNGDYELWRSDGTEMGTTKLTDLPFNAGTALKLKDHLFYSAQSGAAGRELWSTDVNSGVTQLVKDTYPGVVSGLRTGIRRIGDRIFFGGWSHDTGVELWTSDGTTSGTMRVADLNPGVGSGFYSGFAQLNQKLIYGAMTVRSNDELFALELRPNAAIWAPNYVCPSTSNYTACTVDGATGTTYAWTASNAVINAGQGTSSILFTAGVSGNVQLQLTVTRNGQSSMKTFDIPIVPALPQPGDITGPSVPCSGTQATYSIQPVANADTYTWQVPLGFSIVSGQGTPAIVVQVAASSGSVQVQAQNACFLSAVKSLAVNPASGVPAQTANPSGPAQMCANTSATYSVNAVSGAASYLWTVPAGSVIQSGQGSTSVSVLFASQSGNVSVTAMNGCGSSGTSATAVSVSAPPTNANAGPDQNLAAGQVANIQANTPAIGSGLWSIVSGPSTNPTQFGSPGWPSSTFTPAIASGTYTLRWTITNSPCSASTDDVVLTYAAPASVDLQLTSISSQTSLSVGQTGNISLWVENTSAQGATGIQIKVTSTSELNISSVTPAQGSYSAVSGIWSLASLAAFSSAQLDLAGYLTQDVAQTLNFEVVACSEADADSTPNNGAAANEDDTSSWTWSVDPYLFIPDTALKAVFTLDPSIDTYDDDEISPYEAQFVQGLDCSFLGVTDLSGLEMFPAIQWISANGNPIIGLPNMQGMASLNSFFLDDGELASLEDAGQFVFPSGLFFLSLAHNRLQDVPFELFLLQNLEYLDLSGNRLIPLWDAFDNLTNLRTLVLDDTHQQILPFTVGQIPVLESLSINHNHMTSLPPFLPAGLKFFSANDNKLTDLSPLSFCLDLEILHLQHNRLLDISSLNALVDLLNYSHHVLVLDRNNLDAGDCANIVDLQQRADASGAVFSYNPQGNFSSFNGELPQWRVVPNRLMKWVNDVTQETYLTTLSCP